MCGEKLHTLTIGGAIKGEWIDFIEKDISESVCWVFFCNECWLKMKEIRNRK
jgi:hypothetical protein